MASPRYHTQKCISIPQELSLRMEAASEQVPINWSRIARQALEDKLNRIESSDSDVAEVLERLEDISQEVAGLRNRFEKPNVKLHVSQDTLPDSAKPLRRPKKKKTAKKKTTKKKQKRKSKYLAPVLKHLLKRPRGATRKDIWNGLKANEFPDLKVDDLHSVLVNNSRLLTRHESLEEGDRRAFVYCLTKLGKIKAEGAR